MGSVEFFFFIITHLRYEWCTNVCNLVERSSVQKSLFVPWLLSYKKQGNRKFRDDYEGRGLPPVEHFGHVRTKPCIEYGYCLSLASIDGESPFPGYVTPRCCTSIG